MDIDEIGNKLFSLLDSNPEDALKEIHNLPKTKEFINLRSAIITECGISLRNTQVLEEGIEFSRESSRHDPKDLALKYNLANGLYNLGRIKNQTYIDFLTTYKLRKEAKAIFSEIADVRGGNRAFVSQVLNNKANVLISSFRYVEAFYTYQDALNRYNKNGVAAGGVLRVISHFLRMGIGDPSLLNVAAQKYIQIVKENGNVIEELAGKGANKELQGLASKFKMGRLPEKVKRYTGYKGFVFGHNLPLMLTIDGFRLDFRRWDSLTIESLIEEPGQKFQVPELFALFNCIKADFLAARRLLYDSEHGKFPDTGFYHDTLDYAVYGPSVSLLLSSYKMFVDILDKIAHAALIYLKIPIHNPKTLSYLNAWFSSPYGPNVVWCTEIEKEINNGNSALLALTDLALDFGHKDAFANKYKIVRDYSTHKFIILHDMGDRNRNISDNVMHYGLEEFREETVEIAKLVKAAITYFVIMIRISEDRKRGLIKGPIGTMHLHGHHWIRGKK